MTKYRKKPIIIDAVQFVSTEWDKFSVCCEMEDVLGTKFPYFYIRTLEDDMVLKDGDWIITGVEGERYPCKNSIFQKTYEKVDEDRYKPKSLNYEDGYFPPPWRPCEYPEKTEGWLEFQRYQKENPEYYLMGWKKCQE